MIDEKCKIISSNLKRVRKRFAKIYERMIKNEKKV